MTSELASQLQALASELTDVAKEGRSVEPLIRPLEDAAAKLAKAWSGSNFGFHSTVYHASLAAPPPGEHFSSEWGFLGMFQGTTGEWREFPRDEIRALIRQHAGDPDLGPAKSAAARATDALKRTKGDAVSIVSAFLDTRGDEFLASLKSDISKVDAISEHEAIRAQLPSGQFMSRDSVAVGQGLMPGPHQELFAEVVAIRSAFQACEELGNLIQRAASHIDRLTMPSSATARQQGSNVFIGHGRSPLWRELKDFIQDRMKLPGDEFNRVPVAGVTNIARLSQMLDDAGIAFLVLTAEDEKSDGEVVARQNVVHEAGLFQGRLGFTRAIVLLEEGCAEFSNIQGLGQIRFPAGNIAASFEEVRRVVEREGFADA